MPKVLLTALLIYLLSLTLACSNSQDGLHSNPPAISDEAKESAVVYSVVIEDAALDKYEHSLEVPLYISTNSISDGTANWAEGYPRSFDERLESLKKDYKSVSEEVLRSYLSKQLESFKLSDDPKLRLSMRYEFVDGDLVEQELKKSVLDSPPNELPGSILKLSRIGFNSSYDQAFLKIEYVACPLCSFGASYYLEKEDGIWKVKERFDAWIS